MTALVTLLGALVPLYIQMRSAARKAAEAVTKAEAVEREMQQNHKENADKLDQIVEQTDGKLTMALQKIGELEQKLRERQ